MCVHITLSHFSLSLPPSLAGVPKGELRGSDGDLGGQAPHEMLQTETEAKTRNPET